MLKSCWLCGVLLVLPLFTACSPLDRGTADSLRLAWHGGHSAVKPTAASVAAKPYFQMQVTVSGKSSAVLILGSVEGNLQGWYGPHGQAVFLRDGVVVKTLGLAANVDHTRWPHTNPFAAGLQRLSASQADDRVLDWSPGYRYGVPFHAALTPASIEHVDILGQVHSLRRVDEPLSRAAPGLKGVNRFWIDPDSGFVWKSHQMIAPGQALDLLVLRPYRKPAS